MPRWSRDGKKIVFQSNRSGNEDIWTMELETGKWRQLTNDPANDETPIFSPPGDQILFVSDRAASRDIWVMNADGSGQRALTQRPEEDATPCFSPDGKKILFSHKQEGQLGSLGDESRTDRSRSASPPTRRRRPTPTGVRMGSG